MAAPTTTYRMWKRLAERPGGTRLFSAAAMVRVPYFASIVPHVVRMEPGFAEVTVPKWFFVYNHLHTVHAIASCNAAEIAMGMLMEATVPTSHRWIPKAMNVQYLEKATTSLRAQARLDPPDFASITDGTEVVVPVSVIDKSGTEVVHADITCWVTHGSHAHLDFAASTVRGSTSVQIGAMAFAHQAVAVESQHFVDQLATVVAVVDHQRRLAAVDADDLELEVGLAWPTRSSSTPAARPCRAPLPHSRAPRARPPAR